MANNENNQDLNAIDNLNTSLTHAGETVANNKKILYWALGIIAAIAVCGAAYMWLYQVPLVKNSQAAYDQVLTKAMGNDSIAAAEFAKVADKYSRTDAGKLAAIQAATSYYNLGKYKECVKYLDKFSCDDAVLNAQAKVLLGDANVNLKQYDAALSAYNSALRIASGNNQIAPVVLWKEANVYDAQKNYNKALECYEQIKSSYPSFSLGNGMSIEAYIARENARLGK
ncbi:MAG: tetratricopeptide repeat protein [Bacteroides sp.]|nr:tetratricopeptide repeat protein [Bacteroides sp.]MBD5419421.1 tetratricopeptide repeat protein [Bacteroides sp.]